MPMLTGDQDFCCYRDQLRAVPSQLTAFLVKKHYLHATQLLVSALSLGEGSLEGVEALREVRTDLQTKKQVSSLHHLPSSSTLMNVSIFFLFSHPTSTADIIQKILTSLCTFLLDSTFCLISVLHTFSDTRPFKLFIIIYLVKNFPTFFELTSSLCL
jgi:hypothetical protein